MAVDEITSAHVLEPVWTAKPETAGKINQRMETVMDWAITHGRRLDNPPGKALVKVLPRMSRDHNHHLAPHCSEVGWALYKVRESTSSQPGKLAFEFLVLAQTLF